MNHNNKRILGVDLGEKRTGTAVTDLTGTLVGGLEVAEASGLKDCAKKIMELGEQYNVFEIVLGYPVNMNGTKGESALKAEKFKDILANLLKEKELEIKIILFDERLSTSLAHVYMNETNAKNRRGKIDMLSASIILQDYIDSRK
jgi:putative Holliday junction resolvase